MNGSLGLHQAGETLAHRLNPFTKLVLALAFSVSAFITHSLLVQLTLFLVSLLFLYLSKSLSLVIKTIFRFILFFLIVLFVVQSLFWSGESAVWSLGSLDFKVEGVIYSCEVALRLLVVICTFYLLMITTHPSDLVFDLEQRGLPPQGAYVLLATLQAIVEMQERASIIMDVQRCRGVETEGNLLVRARAYFPLIGPLIIGSVLNIESRALALELRGFSSNIPKTYLHRSVEQPWERWLRIALIVFTLFIIVARLAWHLL
jgi:energy-coupling factor transporter transmembrane protein EcfT